MLLPNLRFPSELGHFKSIFSEDLLPTFSSLNARLNFLPFLVNIELARCLLKIILKSLNDGVKAGYGVLVFLFREQALDVDFAFLGSFCKFE